MKKDLSFLKPNVKINRGNKNVSYFYGLDAGWETLELYKLNPFIDDITADAVACPDIIIKDHEATIWYKSNKPKPNNYILTFLADAYFEPLNAKDKPSGLYMEGKYEVKKWNTQKDIE